jgi:undecaprenyl-diphosphatase
MSTHSKAAAHFENYQLRKSVFPDFRSSGLLAKWPIIGAMMFIFGSLAFGALTYNLFAQGPLLVWDRALANMLPAIMLKSSTLVQYFINNVGFYIGNEVIIALVILHALYFCYKRYWQELAMLTIGPAGGGLLFRFLSVLIDRPRPPTQMGIMVYLPGFPSGHAIAVITFYGLMAYLLTPKMPSIFWKVVVVATALLAIVFVGFSRIVSGGHYLTDILAGYAVGIAWSGLAYTLIELYFKKRNSQKLDKWKIR